MLMLVNDRARRCPRSSPRTAPPTRATTARARAGWCAPRQWTKRAIDDGADVRGYFYWTLMDNYEWNHGMDMKFGLYAVGSDAAKTRTARSAVATYGEIIKKGDVSAELLKKFPPE